MMLQMTISSIVLYINAYAQSTIISNATQRVAAYFVEKAVIGIILTLLVKTVRQALIYHPLQAVVVLKLLVNFGHPPAQIAVKHAISECTATLLHPRSVRNALQGRSIQ